MEVQQYSTSNTVMHSKYEMEIFLFWERYIYTHSLEWHNWSIWGNRNEVYSIRLRIRMRTYGLEVGHMD